MDSLVHCIWSSTAAENFEPLALARLLDHAQTLNDASGITGMLLHSRGSFFQVLEGRPVAVEQTFDRIYSDARHRAIVQLLFAPIGQRSFANWPMGFSEIAEAEIARITGRTRTFAKSSCLADLDAAEAIELHKAFASGPQRTRLTHMPRSLEHTA